MTLKINFRQLSILVFMSFIALKFLALPSLLYLDSENMSWIVALVLMIVDAFYAFLILTLMKKSGHRNILDFMTATLGPVMSRVFLVVIMLKYALVIANISKGLEFFVVENFYEKMNWVVFVLPLMLLTGFMAYKGIRNVARVSEIICWAIIVGCIYLAIKSVSGVEPLNFLPLFNDGPLPLFKSGFNHLSWFGSCTFMFMLFGKVDFTKAKTRQMVKYIVFSILLVMLIYFIFFGLFDATAPIHNFAISDISQFTSGHSSIDELSWLVVALWVTAQAVQLALYSYCMVESIKALFNIRSNTFPIIAVIGYIFLWSLIGEMTVGLEKVFLTPYASIITIVATYVLPWLMLIGYGTMGKEKRARFKHAAENEQGEQGEQDAQNNLQNLGADLPEPQEQDKPKKKKAPQTKAKAVKNEKT